MSTPDVKIGDYVPVTISLSKPPIINTFIDLSKYLSKQQYLYGTDFMIAKHIISKTLKEKYKSKILLNNKKNEILNNKKILIKIKFYIKILFRFL